MQGNLNARVESLVESAHAIRGQDEYSLIEVEDAEEDFTLVRDTQ